MAYQVHVWRRKMGVGYQEAMETPFHIVAQDLEMMALENEYSKPRQTKGKQP